MVRTVIVVFPKGAVPREVTEGVEREWSVEERFRKLLEYLKGNNIPYLMREYGTFLSEGDINKVVEGMREWFRRHKKSEVGEREEECYAVTEEGVKIPIICRQYSDWKRLEGKETQLGGVKVRIREVVKVTRSVPTHEVFIIPDREEDPPESNTWGFLKVLGAAVGSLIVVGYVLSKF